MAKLDASKYLEGMACVKGRLNGRDHSRNQGAYARGVLLGSFADTAKD